MARRFLIAVAVMALGAVFVAPSANAAFGIEKWESITCKEDVETPAPGGKLEGLPPIAPPPGQCKGATTPEKLFFCKISWEPLLSARAAKMGLRVAEIPGDEPPRIGGERKLLIWRWGAAYYYQIWREFFGGSLR